MNAFLEGVVAGFGIAIPVGPIAVLIIGLGTRHGFPRAFFAGLGAAMADLIYAGLAATAGAAAAALLAPYAGGLRIAGAVVLFGVAIITAARTFRRSDRHDETGSSHLRTLAAFLSITLLNPVTLTYFAALILGSAGGVAATPAGAALFVAGAFVASLSWQTVLAGIGAVVGHRMSEWTRLATGLIGAVVILLLAVRMLVR